MKLNELTGSPAQVRWATKERRMILVALRLRAHYDLGRKTVLETNQPDDLIFANLVAVLPQLSDDLQLGVKAMTWLTTESWIALSKDDVLLSGFIKYLRAGTGAVDVAIAVQARPELTGMWHWPAGAATEVAR